MAEQSLTARRLALGGSVHVIGNAESRANVALFEKAVYATLNDRAPEMFTVDDILKFVAYETCLLRSDLDYRLCGYGVFLIIFPDRLRRRIFLREHDVVAIDGCTVQFRAWKASKGAEDVRYTRMAWLRILNVPEHHHTRESAECIVSRFGKLVAVDTEKMKNDYSSLDILVECEAGLSIPMQFPLVYDEVHRRQIVILIDLDMHIRKFDGLFLGGGEMAYGDMLKMAELVRGVGNLSV